MRDKPEGRWAQLGSRVRLGVQIFLWGAGLSVIAFIGVWANGTREGWRARGLMQDAEIKWRNEDYLGAVNGYERLIDTYPTGPFVSEAYYWKGMAYSLYLDDPNAAIRAFLKVIRQDLSLDDVRFALKARRNLAEIYEIKLDRPDDAIATYEELIARTSDPEEALESRFKIGELYYAMGDLAQARIEWNLLVNAHPTSSLAPDALYRQGGTYFITGNCKAAVEIYKALYRSYPDDEMSHFAKFRTANCLEMGKQRKEAYALYKELIDGAYPDQALIVRKVEALKPVSNKN